MLAPVLTPAAMRARATRGPNQLVRATFCAGRRSVQGWLFVAAVVFVSFTPACEGQVQNVVTLNDVGQPPTASEIIGNQILLVFRPSLAKETPIVQGLSNRMLYWGQPH